MEVKFGKSFMESLNDLKKRIPSETINNIILNITQTSVFGNSITDVMNNQVEFLRENKGIFKMNLKNFMFYLKAYLTI